MARSTRKTKTKRKPSAKARGTRKSESAGMRTGNDGLSLSTYSSFPKAIKDRFVDGFEVAKSAYGSDIFKVSGELTTGKRQSAKRAIFDYIRESGSEREQLYLSEPNDPGKAFRKGIRSGINLVWQEVGSGRTEYGVRFNTGHRRRNVSAAVMRQAKRAGLSDSYIKRVKKVKGRGNAPATMSSLERDHNGDSFWPVYTAHGTHWHYTIKKYKPGWVVQFMRRDGKSARHFISRTPAASSTKTYYKTKLEAFRSLARHAMKGDYAAYKNPSRRR
jgi:hypothetical protein